MSEAVSELVDDFEVDGPGGEWIEGNQPQEEMRVNQSKQEESLVSGNQSKQESLVSGNQNKKESLMTKLSLVSRGVSQLVSNEAIVDTSDKFALIAVFLSSVVLSYLFESATEFVPKYSFMLQCTNSTGYETYEATAGDATRFGVYILSFTLAYLLAWIAFRVLNPTGALKLSLLGCLLIYGLGALLSALYYCTEIIVVMAVNTSLDCTVSRYGKHLKTSYIAAILAPIFLAALPIGHRVHHLVHIFLDEGRRAPQPLPPNKLRAAATRIRAANRIANVANHHTNHHANHHADP
eukprot:TRINITY_DN6919_c0_g1_i11.p1 TRINITY_DN6919_c0_g1~~TRINITY_DN6919_c0_g1_i11.p1  ORF type:complete len:339 (+),score=78.33 TRINITY_DN6919_c0_g1_i11:136-1017(+)